MVVCINTLRMYPKSGYFLVTIAREYFDKGGVIFLKRFKSIYSFIADSILIMVICSRISIVITELCI